MKRLVWLLAAGVTLAGIAENAVGKFDPLMAERKSSVDTNGVKWIDGRCLPLEGRAFDDTEHYYDRLPANVTTNVNAGVRNMKHHTSGMLFRFATDSKTLRFKWTPYNPGLAMDHMPSTGVSGIDVYRFDAKVQRWRYVKTGRIWSAEGGSLEIPWTPDTPCLVNLPLYNGIRTFSLGIDKDAHVRELPPRKSGVTKPVVFYGTSITHGGCCSRPGMGFVNILGRMYDLPVVNLGFSGSGRMELEMSEHLARIDASCYVLDCLWNMGSRAFGDKPGATVEENFEPFVRNLRAKRPDVPIVIAESCDVYCGESPRSPHHQAKDRFVRGVYDKLIAEGWKRLHWLPKDEMYADDFEGTVDGAHPNDAGMQTLVVAYGKAVLAALAGTVETPGVTWIDGGDLPAEGRPFPDSPTYARIPPRFAGVLPRRDMVLGTNTAGRVFRFVTDAKKLRFHWSLAFPEAKDMHHMSMTGVSGIDVYRRTGDGPWFAHTGRRRLLPLWTPKYDGSYRYEMDWTPGDECLLYLPCYNGIASFELGVDEGVSVRPGPAHRGAAKPVVLFGHSITQGGCASRGGLIWPAIVGRRLDVEIVNLGLSGSALMEIEWARALGELDPSVFVIDTADNQTVERAETRYEPFLRELKRLKPDVPILVLENTDVHDRAGKAKVEDIIRGICEKLWKEDPAAWANLEILRHAEYAMDDEGTVDGIHLNDLGMMKVADAVERRLRPLLGRPYVKVDFTRQRLFPGFDGKFCKICPSVATDGKGKAFLTWQRLLLSGSDVFYGLDQSLSADGGKTWSAPRQATALADTYERGLRATYAGSPVYGKRADRWFGLGLKSYYKDDKEPFQQYVDGHPYQVPLYLDFDAEAGAFTGYRELPFPFEFAGGFPFGQRVEEENGDFTVPFYFKPLGAVGAKTRVVTVRYRLAESNLVVVAAGTPVGRDDLRRGLGEPSLAKLGTKYYLTFRSDESGFVSESDDGLNFSVPRPWTWDGKVSIGNRNTQQHWVKLGNALFLAYTREGAGNDHVFRNRAPIFLAQFDPVRLCLLKETERTIVPELGTRLGNFCVADAGDEQWLVTAEWMQPRGCERYGSDNSIWFVRMKPQAQGDRR